MAATELVFGPMSRPYVATNSALSTTTHVLNDADNAMCLKLCLPKDGTITKVGFLATAITGTPPAYNVGLVTIDSLGRPSTTAYGGSTNATWTPAATGWAWINLAVSATANAGDYAAVHVWPGSTPPDAGNCVTLSREVVEGYALTGLGAYPCVAYYTAGWNQGAGPAPIALAYDDGTIVGYSIEARGVVSVHLNTTPDEVGNAFTVPVNCTCVGLRAGIVGWSNGATWDVVLYDSGSTAIATHQVTDEDFLGSASQLFEFYFDAVALTAGATYRATIKPLQNLLNAQVNYLEFDAAADRACLPDGTRYQKTERTDGGAWTNTNTVIMAISPIISDITSVPGTTGGSHTFA